MSKRNQKRIEHELKDLINDRSNANKCGECGAGFPTWASVNLGVFLCGRCASLHRKLGEDVSFVKSLSLDKWDEEDLDSLSRIGNKKAKQIWNPKKVPFPFDDDDKDEIYQYLRQKYIQGKFRYDPIDEDDYNLRPKSRSHKSRSRSSTVNSRPSSRPSVSSRSIPRLSHRDISEYDRLKLRSLEKRLEEQGFTNTDDNYESLYLAKGDFNLAIDILSNSAADDRPEAKPALPRRPGTSVSNGGGNSQSISQPVSASSDWWNGASQQTPSPAVFDGTTGVNPQQATGLIQPPQQYLDPATGIIYVDPIQQEQYLQQQQQLQLQQQQTGFFQQTSQQQPQQTGVFQQPQQTGIFQQPQQQQQTGAFYQQPFQTGGVMPQRTGVDKNQLLSLYNTGGQPQQQSQQQQQGYQFNNGFNGYSYQ